MICTWAETTKFDGQTPVTMTCLEFSVMEVNGAALCRPHGIVAMARAKPIPLFDVCAHCGKATKKHPNEWNCYLKQVIVVRKDLSMPTGKTAVMVAHASMKFILDRWQISADLKGPAAGGKIKHLHAFFTPDECQWMTELDPGQEFLGQQSMAKVVLFVDTERALLDIAAEATLRSLTVGRVWDSGFSHNPAGTYVAAAIGPHWAEAFIGLTDHLKTR